MRRGGELWQRCNKPMLASFNIQRQSRLDIVQIAAVLLLMLVSVAFVYSATMAGESANMLAWYRQVYFRQTVWFMLGLVAAGAVCVVDYHTICRWAFVAYWLSIPLLIAVLIPGIGVTHNSGARRWIDIGSFFQFQPSEFAKLAFILAQAHFLSRPVDELRRLDIFWKSIGLLALPFLLIIKEPDLGSALVLVPTGLAMLYAAGTPKTLLVAIAGSRAESGGIVSSRTFCLPHPRWQIKMQEYQKKRLLVYFGRNYADSAAAGANRPSAGNCRKNEFKDSYNVNQALIAVGSGGLSGKGWRQGQQNALGFLPSAGKHNDFIFSVIAEEIGFRRQRGRAHALFRGSVHRDQNRGPGARPPGQIAGGGRRHAHFQPCLHQHRNEHPHHACDGRATAAA